MVNSLIGENAKRAEKYLKKLTKKMKDHNASIFLGLKSKSKFLR